MKWKDERGEEGGSLTLTRKPAYYNDYNDKCVLGKQLENSNMTRKFYASRQLLSVPVLSILPYCILQDIHDFK